MIATEALNDGEIILNPDAGRVISGLRDTGYDFNTAIADLVDNAIAANATVIKVHLELNPQNKVSIYIADNGCGMDMDDLKNAMTYGSKKRKDPRSLGKFGLGLKTASTAFCRCLSLVSTTDGDVYTKVRWDIDEVKKVNKWILLTPDIEPNEKNFLKTVSGNGHGTLVIWTKVDRLIKEYSQHASAQKALNKLIDELKFHLSVVYQKFLDPRFGQAPNVEIFVNSLKIKPWDPFCITERNTKKVGKETFEVTLNDGTKSEFSVTAYIIPRKSEYSTLQAEKNARVSNEMQGFYVYREHRLIYFGGWMNMFSREPHGSLLRVELSFDCTLDDYFYVDIKKSRILLNDEIFDKLKNNFLPAPRRAADERYRKGTDEKVAEIAENAHDSSNQNIDDKANLVEDTDIKIIDPEEGKVELSNEHGTFLSHIVVKGEEKPGQCRVEPVDNLEDGVLWNAAIIDGKHAVQINTGHPYYQKIYYPVLKQHVLVTGMDALLWAFSEAELAAYRNDESREQYEDFRIEISRILKKLLKDLPEPDVNSEKEE